ncbi:MAG TPA: hypothetical protein VE631_06585 [Alphaproteobacteria bacterium]|jgi:hypothetical protein|nr:hypothetical protein [Alphaproteobacteria bacterium]
MTASLSHRRLETPGIRIRPPLLYLANRFRDDYITYRARVRRWP